MNFSPLLLTSIIVFLVVTLFSDKTDAALSVYLRSRLHSLGNVFRATEKILNMCDGYDFVRAKHQAQTGISETSFKVLLMGMLKKVGGFTRLHSEKEVFENGYRSRYIDVLVDIPPQNPALGAEPTVKLILELKYKKGEELITSDNGELLDRFDAVARLYQKVDVMKRQLSTCSAHELTQCKAMVWRAPAEPIARQLLYTSQVQLSNYMRLLGREVGPSEIVLGMTVIGLGNRIVASPFYLLGPQDGIQIDSSLRDYSVVV